MQVSENRGERREKKNSVAKSHVTMPEDVLLACVGKPSAGKSSFLNAVTDANAKVGA